MNITKASITQLVNERNEKKPLFTAGPAALLPENLSGLRPCFGRNDPDYETVEEDVLMRLRTISGHANIARLQGSASLALEIAALNFLNGRVLIVDTGYYSQRLYQLACTSARREGRIRQVDSVSWTSLESVNESYDWVFSCVTETSAGILIPIKQLATLSRKVKARLMLDATASIGLEIGHEAADVIAYSSCKGLFGLVGAAFIAFNEHPKTTVDSFYLNLDRHLSRGVTGPYHAIASLYEVLPRHADFAFAVNENKRLFVSRMSEYLAQALDNQPQLCTHVKCQITSKDPRAILYKPRNDLGGAVICHLGEVHLGRSSKADLLNLLEVGL
jgi:2-aminoethylphosphonate-pyruvate transaminase